MWSENRPRTAWHQSVAGTVHDSEGSHTVNLHKPEMGYLLLGPPPPKVPSYRGIDRNPFEPLILEGEIQEIVLNFGNIWELYPPGWRRDAYRIFEENQKEVGG